ncbi:MAG: peptidyl-prolyl cis-trans isomerase [bacterium]|nr:peptidyl-prolyl cis-trans isomerase [bacterium]MDY4100905.1 peptidyl-prolyl cis-trans isomerase [Lachnospiraceae bacterium]
MRLKRWSALALAGVITAGTVLTGCGAADPEETVATVNSIPISLGVANFAAQFTAVDYDTYYMSYFGQDMWSSDPGNTGKTMTETVKDTTLDTLEEYYLLEQHMADYDVSITDDEMKAIDEAAAQFVSDNTEEALQALCFGNQDYVKEFLRLNLIQKKMRDAIVADVDTDVPDEDCAQKTFSYVRVSKTVPGSSDEDSEDEEEKTDEEKAAEAKEKAQKILDEAMIGSEEDPLQAAADKNDANKSTCAYGAADLSEDNNSTYMELNVLEAVEKLGEGEFSKQLVETDKYYYVLRMDSLFDQDATDRKRASIISDREDDLYDEIVDSYKESADWTVDDKVWKTVNFDTIYSKSQAAAEDSAADDTQTDADAQTDESAAENADTNAEAEK